MRFAKFFACLVLAVSAIGLVGCAGDSDTTPAATSTEGGEASGTQAETDAAKKEASDSK